MSVTLKDFYPINHWNPDVDGDQWNCCARHRGTAKFIIDMSTNRRYLNEDRGTVRIKSFLLTLGTPIVHSVAAICNVAYRTLKILTLSHFWMEKEQEKSYNFKERLVDAGVDFLKIVEIPLAMIGLELSAIYGIFRPYDGRKLYASIERATYGNFILAPCFQPNPKHHALGGDINEKGAF